VSVYEDDQDGGLGVGAAIAHLRRALRDLRDVDRRRELAIQRVQDSQKDIARRLDAVEAADPKATHELAVRTADAVQSLTVALYTAALSVAGGSIIAAIAVVKVWG
jgi:hypothetical protein